MSGLGTDERTATIVAAYMEAAVWTSTDGETQLEDLGFTVADIADGAVAEIRIEVDDFLALIETEGLDVSELEPAQIGHDLWLSRNGHGAGFFDRGLGDVGDRLQDLARSYGASDLYVGDDGELHVTP